MNPPASIFVTVFRTRVRPEVLESPELSASLEALGVRMYELASAKPGFLADKDYTAADGEFLSIIEFDTANNLLAWRQHPEHLEAQRRGRDEFFSWYQIQVCQVARQYSHGAF